MGRGGEKPSHFLSIILYIAPLAPHDTTFSAGGTHWITRKTKALPPPEGTWPDR